MRGLFFIIILILFSFIACNNSHETVINPTNSAYYWKTVFNLDSTEQQFILNNNVRKLYIRYFDVKYDATRQMPMPNATISFPTIPDASLEVIPTVFIMENCFKYDMDTLATKLVERCLQISKTNHVGDIHEIQIDCDWTAKSQEKYFRFLQKIYEYLAIKQMRLSVTIRLHQLKMTPPPCNYGVLMLYNTGNYKDRRIENPILGYQQCEPYLKYLKSYQLPMCIAFPNFCWQIQYHNENYANILYNLNLADSSIFYQVDKATYIVCRNREVPIYMGNEDFNVVLSVGDTIKEKKAEYQQIMKVKNAVARIRKDILAQTIIYDLNSNNINNLNKLEYEKIFDSEYFDADNGCR